MMNRFIRQINALGWGRALIVILVVWFVVIVMAILPMISNGNGLDAEVDHKLAVRLAQAITNLDSLQKQNEELRRLLSEISNSQFSGDQTEIFETIKNRIQHTERLISNKQDFGFITSKEEPNSQYEKLRRRIQNTVHELGYLMSSELQKLINKPDTTQLSVVKPSLKYLHDLSMEHKRFLIKDLNDLAQVDGYDSWRDKESQRLSDIVQRRLEKLQNPQNCSKAKKLVCNLNKGCGYGCQLHHLTFCLTTAYGSGRTLILNSKGWRYHKNGWEEIFLPVSNSCTTYSGPTAGWSGIDGGDAQILNLPIIDNQSPLPKYAPSAIPEDLAPHLIRLHGDPIVWWIGQLLKYLLRSQPHIEKMIQQATTHIGFQKPIVGIHVRRTDKIGTEAAFHSIDEYMAAVDSYYEQLEMSQKVDERRIYIATDDPDVIAKAKKKYTNYLILGDSDIAKTASVSTRYSHRSLIGIILDIHFLSITDYLVCTFSSQVCRVAYEIMQSYWPDASSRFRTLDDIYYFGGGTRHIRVAHIAHKPKRNDEIELAVGDQVHIAGNHWNGFSKGRNLRTNQLGLFPSFKVEDKVQTSDFETYPDLPFSVSKARLQKQVFKGNT